MLSCNAGEAHLPHSCLLMRLLLHLGVGRSTHSRNAGEALGAQCGRDLLLRLLGMQRLFVSLGRVCLSFV
jgi:hypothetical protein